MCSARPLVQTVHSPSLTPEVVACDAFSMGEAPAAEACNASHAPSDGTAQGGSAQWCLTAQNQKAKKNGDYNACGAAELRTGQHAGAPCVCKLTAAFLNCAQIPWSRDALPSARSLPAEDQTNQMLALLPAEDQTNQMLGRLLLGRRLAGRRLAKRVDSTTKCSDVLPLQHDEKQNARAWSGSKWCACGTACPALPMPHGTRPALGTPVLVIGAEHSCYERTKAVARAAGFFGAIERHAARFVGAEDVLKRCCPRGFCGKGARLKPAARAVMDGGMQAHRGVWQRVIESGVPNVILEDDVRLLGAASDLAYAIDTCRLADCSLACAPPSILYMLTYDHPRSYDHPTTNHPILANPTTSIHPIY